MRPLKEFFADYHANGYDDEILSDWGSALLYRPIGLTLAWLLSATRTTPNSVTAIAAMLLPLMVVATTLCQPVTALHIVLFLAIIYLILDCTDGSLARMTGHVSVSGHYFDLVTDLAYRGCVYVTVGYLADQIDPLPFPVNQMSCMALAAWFAALARLARMNLDRLAPRSIAEKSDQKAAATFTFYSFLSGIDTLFPLFVVIAYTVDVLSFFIPWIVFYSLADVIVALLEARGRLRSYPR